MLNDAVTEQKLMAVLQESIRRRAEAAEGAAGSPPPPRPPLNTGGGSGRFGPMEERVSRLETHMEYVHRDLDALKSGQDKILDRIESIGRRLDDIPTRSDLRSFRWQWVATAVAAIALIVGGIIGGLSWIKPEASPQAPPTIIQIPVPTAPKPVR